MSEIKPVLADSLYLDADIIFPDEPQDLGEFPDISDEEILHIFRDYKAEAEEGRDPRIDQNKENLDAYFGRQDYSYKDADQSREFLPKVPLAVEQFKSFVKRALVDFGDWFSCNVPPGPIDEHMVRRLLLAKLETLSYLGEHKDFPTIVTDAIHVGSLESLMVVKVYGRKMPKTLMGLDQQIMATPTGPVPGPMQVAPITAPVWELCVDLIPPQDYYPDPTGRGLYELHIFEHDLSYAHEMAEAGAWRPEIVSQINGSYTRPDDERREDIDKGQGEVTHTTRRRTIEVGELWGALIDRDGRCVAKNIVCTIVNDQYVVRRPESNRSWDGKSPFITSPLIRVPFSEWHKALMDHAVQLNLAQNDVFNLILDGGTKSAQSVNQIRAEWLENPAQVSNGIQPGDVLKVKAEMPLGMKVLEPVATGEIPRDALQLYSIVNNEFNQAAITNDLGFGTLPSQETKATAIVQAEQGRAGVTDGIIRDAEDCFIEPILRKAWMTILQDMPSLIAEEVVTAVGLRGAMVLGTMQDADRFKLFQGSKFKVNGLSATLARNRDFQKLLALADIITKNPLLAQAYTQEFSWRELFVRLMKMLNIDPEGLRRKPDEAGPPGLGGGSPGVPGGMQQAGSGAPRPPVPAGPEPPALPDVVSLAGGTGALNRVAGGMPGGLG